MSKLELKNDCSWGEIGLQWAKLFSHKQELAMSKLELNDDFSALKLDYTGQNSA